MLRKRKMTFYITFYTVLKTSRENIPPDLPKGRSAFLSSTHESLGFWGFQLFKWIFVQTDGCMRVLGLLRAPVSKSRLLWICAWCTRSHFVRTKLFR